jgi:hypothetical protein
MTAPRYDRQRVVSERLAFEIARIVLRTQRAEDEIEIAGAKSGGERFERARAEQRGARTVGAPLIGHGEERAQLAVLRLDHLLDNGGR